MLLPQIRCSAVLRRSDLSELYEMARRRGRLEECLYWQDWRLGRQQKSQHLLQGRNLSQSQAKRQRLESSVWWVHFIIPQFSSVQDGIYYLGKAQHSLWKVFSCNTLCEKCSCSYDTLCTVFMQLWHSLCKVLKYDTFCAKNSAAIISVYGIQLPSSVYSIQLQSSVCTVFSCHHLCVQYSTATISVYSIQLPSSLCTAFSCHHLCVQYSAAIISVYSIQLPTSVYSIQLQSSLCTVFSCHHLCVQYSAAIISEYGIQLQSSPCQTFCWDSLGLKCHWDSLSVKDSSAR